MGKREEMARVSGAGRKQMAQPNNGSEEKVRQRLRQHCRQSTGNRRQQQGDREPSPPRGLKEHVRGNQKSCGLWKHNSTNHRQLTGWGPGSKYPRAVPQPPPISCQCLHLTGRQRGKGPSMRATSRIAEERER